MKNKSTVSDLAKIIEQCENSIIELEAGKEEPKKKLKKRTTNLKK